MNTAAVAILWTLAVIAFVLAYWVPSFIAFHRHVPNQWSIAVLNLFAFALGVTWIIALVLAVRDVPRPPPPAWPPASLN